MDFNTPKHLVLRQNSEVLRRTVLSSSLNSLPDSSLKDMATYSSTFVTSVPPTNDGVPFPGGVPTGVGIASGNVGNCDNWGEATAEPEIGDSLGASFNQGYPLINAHVACESEKVNRCPGENSEASPQLSKSQRKRRAQKLRKTQVSQNSVPCSSTPMTANAAKPTMASVVSSRGGKRTQKDLSSSDPLQNTRPEPKRKCGDEAKSANTDPNLIMVIRKVPIHNCFSISERATLEDHINMVFIQDDRSVSGLRWLQISRSPYALQYECSTEDAFAWLSTTLSNIGQLWEGCRLHFCRRSELPKLTNLFAYFPGSSWTTYQIFSTLERYNEGLSTSQWRVFERENKSNPRGVTFRLGVDLTSLGRLKELNFKPQYGVWTANFYGHPISKK